MASVTKSLLMGIFSTSRRIIVKKRMLALLLATASISMLSAVTLEDAISSAQANNKTYQNQVVTYQKGLLTLEKMDLEDETAVNLGISVNPLLKTASVAGVKGLITDINEYGMAITPTASVTLSDKKTTIKGSMPYLVDYNGKVNSISPSIGASYTYDFNEYDDDVLSDLNYAISKYTTEYTYANAGISLKKNLISIISNILSIEMNIKDSEKKVRDTEKTLEDYKTLSSFSESSLTYITVVNALDNYNRLLSSYNEQLEIAKSSYRNLTGLDWSGLDYIPEPELSVSVLDKGNTQVMLQGLAVQQKEETYKKTAAGYDVDLLSFDGKAEGNVNMLSDSGKTAGSLSISGSIGYSANSWSVSASPSFSWSFSNSSSAEFTPGLTIAATWTNDTKIKSFELDKQDKLYDVTKAENDYSASQTNYVQQAQEYSTRISSWNMKKLQNDSNKSYLEAVYENKKALFEVGLATDKEVEDARFNLEKAGYEYDIMLLEGLSLQCDLEIFAL